MRLLVYGGRNFVDSTKLWRRLDGLLKEAQAAGDTLVIIQGDNGKTDEKGRAIQGADLLSKQWAIDNADKGVEHADYPARWHDFEDKPVKLKRGPTGIYNVLAGFNRNLRMLVEGKPDCALECPGGTGTKDMRERLRRAGIEPMRLH